MKNQLSALDIYVLINELKKELSYAKIQKIQGLADRGLKLKVYSKKISGDLSIMPNYFCISKYPRKTPEKQSSFILQLRKNIKNLTLNELKQHNLDRIVEFSFEGTYGRFMLIAELFSTGNFLFCDKNKKIIGLLERQQWKDRTLNVGRDYEYPPSTINPFELTFQEFAKILSSSKKSIVATLAREINLGGNFAEEVCFISKTQKEKEANEFSDKERKALYASLNEILKRADEEKKPAIVLDNGKAIDVVPFDLELYKNTEKKYFENFNDAVDEYFSKLDMQEIKTKSENKVNLKIQQFEIMKQKQINALKELQEREIDKKKIADVIYQNFSAIEKILTLVKETKDKEKLIGAEVDSILIKKIDKLSLTIELNGY